MWDSGTLMGALTPKFYVALTGTSSLISGLILIFEWWYFRKYGTSFIEQISFSHLGPWLGAADTPPQAHQPHQTNDCKVWRNPMALLRGAEYGRLWNALRRAPLTYYDMNLSAQEHQAWFGFNTENSSGCSDGAEECMQRAWREREPGARVAAARAALARRPDCAAALLLLAEEDAPTVHEAERVLKKAWRAAEGACRAAPTPPEARRAAAVLAHVKRRAGMCARRLGRLRDAVRLFRELARDAPPALHNLQLHENLIEALLEQRAYPDVQAVVARVQELGFPPSATLLYTEALLRARAAPAAPPPHARQADLAALEVSVSPKLLYTEALLRARAAPPPHAQADLAALVVSVTATARSEALRRAIEFNPWVPAYLLETRALTLPPEHVVRRGDSEAVAYAFAHLTHWRRHDAALRLLRVAWRAHRRIAAGVAACARSVDAELLPAHHAVVAPRRSPMAVPAALCGLCAMLALLAHRLTLAQIDPGSLLRLLADV